MKFHHLGRAALVLLTAILLTTGAARSQTVVGTGNASSYLVIQGPGIGSLFYQVFYNYNPSVHLDTYYLLNLVTSADPSLSISYSNFGSSESPNYFIDAITYAGTTLTNVGAPDFSPFWYQSVSGGESGYPTIAPIDSGSWQEGSGISYRYVAPGSWDGFVYGEAGDGPTIAPVPEPSICLLFGTGGIFLLLLKRRKTYA